MMRNTCFLVLMVTQVLFSVPAFAWGPICHIVFGNEYGGMGPWANWADWVAPWPYVSAALWGHELCGLGIETACYGLPFAHSLHALARDKLGPGFWGYGHTDFANASPVAKGFAIHAVMDSPVHYEYFPLINQRLHAKLERQADCIMFYERLMPVQQGRTPPIIKPTNAPNGGDFSDLLWPGSGLRKANAVYIVREWVVFDNPSGSSHLLRVALDLAHKTHSEHFVPPWYMPLLPPFYYANWTEEGIDYMYNKNLAAARSIAASFSWQEYYDSVASLRAHLVFRTIDDYALETRNAITQHGEEFLDGP